MKKLILSGFFLTLIIGCQAPTDQTDEVADVERVVFDFFESIASFNYPALRDHCTEDFYLFEDGQKMNLNQFINLVKSFEHQATIHYELEDIRTEIAGSLAWMTLRTKALMNLNGQGTNLEWLESAVLKKQQDLWRIAFYHSSVVKGKEPSKS